MKVALIGAYGHQGYVISGIPYIRDCRMVALARSEPGEDMSGLQRACQQLLSVSPPIYDDYRVMLDKEKPDVVGVSPMFCRHQEISVECLKRDISVMCEKPVAMNLEELAALRKAYAESRGEFVGMHGMRYQANFLAGYRALKDGVIGRPILINSQKSYAFSLARPQFYKKRATFGSTLCWVAIHALDWTYWMMGPFKTIYAAHTRIGNWGYEECESSGVIAFTFEQGGQGCINFDFLKAHKDPIPQDRCRIAGEKGTIEIYNKKAFAVTHEREPYELPLEPEESFFKGFVDQIRGEGSCLLTAEDTFEVTRLALLARESADTDALIRVAERPLP